MYENIEHGPKFVIQRKLVRHEVVLLDIGLVIFLR